MFTKLIGYKYFTQTDKEGNSTQKVRCCFLDSEKKADEGDLFISLNFKADNLPELKKELIGKECLVDVGFYNGSQYGKGLMFTGK